MMKKTDYNFIYRDASVGGCNTNKEEPKKRTET